MQLEMFPDIRYRHDADELRRLGDWVDRLREDAAPHDVPHDYLHLADRLDQLADQAREFARQYLTPIP